MSGQRNHALLEAAFHLTLGGIGVDHSAQVMGKSDTQHLDLAGLGIHLHFDEFHGGR